MANFYGYAGSSYGGSGGGYEPRAATSAADSYYSSRYGSSNPLASSTEIMKYTPGALDLGSSLYSTPATSSIHSGIKRSAEALYNQTVLRSHNPTGQSDGLYSTNSMFKHPRFEMASSLPMHPQRPGEKDCAHYMLTRTCKYGEACKFDHPSWVPEGGIPDWKELPLPLALASESLPERAGEPDCPFFLKTKTCKFGVRCKFNHPKDQLNRGVEFADPSVLPERPTEQICAFYSKTGKCKYGANCKFHHPKDLQIPSTGTDIVSMEPTESAAQNKKPVGDTTPANTFVPFIPALLHNSKGLPVRPGETDCPFYLKTGSCKYGATCRYNHPEITAINPPYLGNANLPVGLFGQVANLIPNLDPMLLQTSFGVGSTVYPQRPGQTECDFYMKTGQCKYGEQCRFHHPIDRFAPVPAVANQVQPNIKLTLAGLPRREGALACAFYMKTGTCKYGVACRFDHPPPGEAVAMATVQGGKTTETGADATGKEEVASDKENDQ